MMDTKFTTTTLDDIYGLYEPSIWENTALRWSLIGLGTLLLMALVGYVLYRRFKKPLDPLAHALQLLAAVDPESCTTQKDFKKLYAELCRVLKTYTSQGLGWQTASCTDQELIAILAQTRLNAMLVDQLRRLIDEATWVKFANQDALRSQAHKDKSLILETIQALHTLFKTPPHATKKT